MEHDVSLIGVRPWTLNGISCCAHGFRVGGSVTRAFREGSLDACFVRGGVSAWYAAGGQRALREA